jgi:hypothetical protein
MHSDTGTNAGILFQVNNISHLRLLLDKSTKFIKTKHNYILQIPTMDEYAYHTSKQASPSTINLETHPSHKLYSHPGYSLSASSSDASNTSQVMSFPASNNQQPNRNTLLSRTTPI